MISSPSELSCLGSYNLVSSAALVENGFSSSSIVLKLCIIFIYPLLLSLFSTLLPPELYDTVLARFFILEASDGLLLIGDVPLPVSLCTNSINAQSLFSCSSSVSCNLQSRSISMNTQKGSTGKSFLIIFSTLFLDAFSNPLIRNESASKAGNLALQLVSYLLSSCDPLK